MYNIGIAVPALKARALNMRIGRAQFSGAKAKVFLWRRDRRSLCRATQDYQSAPSGF